MRVAVFAHNGSRRLGVVHADGGRLVDVAEAADASGVDAPRDLLGLIEAGPQGLDVLRRLAESGSGAAVRELSTVKLLAPFEPTVGNVICIGRNYQKHAEEGAVSRGEEVKPPTVFSKAITSVAGPSADLHLPFSVSAEIDWEVELGVVIGRTGRDIPRREALEHVFGYTVVNDVSVRDVQFGWGGQFFKGKSYDDSCPLGPWIVTADEIPDPQKLSLRCLVNGEVKQDANTADMIYPVDAIIEWISRGMTLRAGSLIATGTPEGVGFARNPPEFLKDGDLLESEVQGIGSLRNRVGAA